MPGALSLAARVQQTGGYCWPTYIKVLGVRFPGKVSPVFLPSKKACWTHKFRHLGVNVMDPPLSNQVSVGQNGWEMSVHHITQGGESKVAADQCRGN